MLPIFGNPSRYGLLIKFVLQTQSRNGNPTRQRGCDFFKTTFSNVSRLGASLG
jgi:hypothetical protein